MNRISIQAQKREKTRKLRSMVDEGFIPAVIYDQSGKSTNIKIAANLVERMTGELKGTPLVDVIVEGEESQIALLKEIQYDQRKNVVNHISFMALDPKKEALFDVDIVMTGESPAVRNSLGILIAQRNSVELRGLPSDIPSTLKADVSTLKKVGDVITIGDLDIPENLSFVTDDIKEIPVATIQPFQKTVEDEIKEQEEAEKAAAAEAAEAEGEEGEIPEGEEGAETPEGEEGAAEGEKAEATESGEEKPAEE